MFKKFLPSKLFSMCKPLDPHKLEYELCILIYRAASTFPKDLWRTSVVSHLKYALNFQLDIRTRTKTVHRAALITTKPSSTLIKAVFGVFLRFPRGRAGVRQYPSTSVCFQTIDSRNIYHELSTDVFCFFGQLDKALHKQKHFKWDQQRFVFLKKCLSKLLNSE